MAAMSRVVRGRVQTHDHIVFLARTSDDIELAYEVMGADGHARAEVSAGEPLVLIMGIGAQLIYWPDSFCKQLAARGYDVIRFDNRDVGLSSKLHGQRAPALPALMKGVLTGAPPSCPYTLADMADDVVGLLDHLGIQRAHVVGASMGGMIAQTISIRHPGRVASLTSIMSHPGGKRYLVSSPRAVRVLLAPAPKSRLDAMDRAERFYRIAGSRAFPRDVALIRERAGRAYDRCFYPAGFARQMAAILSSPSRRGALREVRVPASVVHGSVDPLILPRGGRDTARALRAAELEMIEGMGHDLPEGAWPRIIDAIDRAAGRSRPRGRADAPTPATGQADRASGA